MLRVHVFDLFLQAGDTVGHVPKGPGIGLWIARRLVARHGGTITASSPGPGLGSEFVVRLPLDAPTPETTLHPTNGDALLMVPALGP